LRRLAEGSALLVVVGIAWQLATLAADSPYFPTPLEILAQVRENWLSGPASALFLTPEVTQNVVPSIGRMFGGYLVAAVIGVVVGTAIGLSRGLAGFVNPIIHFARAIPPPAMIPLFLIVLGLGTPMKVGLIAFGVVWPILLNTTDGVRSVDKTQLETGRVFGITGLRRLTHIVLPAASPKIFAGLRVSLSLALILMVISEMVAATDGIGFGILQAQRTFKITDMWAGMVLLAVLGCLFNMVLLAVEARVLGWYRGSRGGAAG
jgi:ABC-type nitrate/sulfonate/bicarbonate transport system permease component